MIEEKKSILISQTDFKRLVLQYGKRNIGKQVTYASFIKWLKKNYDLYQEDNQRQLIFKSILQRNFHVSISYCRTANKSIINVFEIKK